MEQNEKIEKKKLVYEIMTSYWKLIKPLIDNPPETAEEWDKLVRDAVDISLPYRGYSDINKFAEQICKVCLDFINKKAKERKR